MVRDPVTRLTEIGLRRKTLCEFIQSQHFIRTRCDFLENRRTRLDGGGLADACNVGENGWRSAGIATAYFNSGMNPDKGIYDQRVVHRSASFEENSDRVWIAEPGSIGPVGSKRVKAVH